MSSRLEELAGRFEEALATRDEKVRAAERERIRKALNGAADELGLASMPAASVLRAVAKSL